MAPSPRSAQGFLPHGLSFAWDETILWSQVMADALIALAYFSIPVAITLFYLRRPGMPHRRVAALVSAFILACGCTHVLDIWVVWNPDYGLQATIKLLAAAVSLATAYVLWPLLPKALKIPSMRQLSMAIELLESEVRKRMSVEQHLLDTEQSLAITLNSIGAGFIKTDAQGRIKRINGAALALTGTQADFAHDRLLAEVLQPAPQADGAEAAPGLFADLQRLAGREERIHELTLLSADGRTVSVEIRCALNFDAHDAVTGATLLVRDLSAIRQAEEERLKSQALEAENRQIQETNRTKTLFLANMSHELRTPLNAIIGFAELLESGAVPVDSPKHAQFLSHISTSGNHLLRLINDVLDLSKVDAGKLAFAPESMQLQEVVGTVLTDLQAWAAEKRLTVHTRIDASIGAVSLDQGRFKQALYNYLSNAIKFTPEGGTIAVRALPEGAEHFRLEVEDSGIGIAAADLPRLFTEFQQLDSSFTRKHQGTGLGLALTKRLIEAQGGRVGVRSTPGVGSVFHLVLPRVTAAVNPD